ncbi:hypothetical protein ACNRBH_06810 [Ralstonia pseudosolanacearum]|uniref:hypothetical protein n=1 Tax=Ralstonia pseudosolanacearum TaxID=1310165 RepID=UPI002676C721|nr:hypothetical protein [Ralstonia pseudosolanacearum]MDO3527685.1 hypothetical protein [Ralstonia pseudosolanacearum]MDO3531991.1 hypothetical protein [Ralstonia pseudosolanacearum]
MPFVDDLRDFLNLTHAYAWHCAHAANAGSAPDEPGLVSSLIARPMLKELERLVKQHLQPSGQRVLLNGIFTHKTPTVLSAQVPTPPGGNVRTHPVPNSVEIGDLLFVRQHVDPSGKPVQGRAFLLQAKRNTTPDSGNVSTGNPRIQFDLYSAWPEFLGATRLRSHAAGTTAWNFPATSTHPGPQAYGRYLAVYDGKAFDPPASGQWTGAPPPTAAGLGTAWSSRCSWMHGPARGMTLPLAYPVVPCPSDFAPLLADFVDGRAGIPFIPTHVQPATADHWSIFINEMLAIAALPNYTYRSVRTNVRRARSRNGRIATLATVLPILGLIETRHREWNWEAGPLGTPRWIDWSLTDEGLALLEDLLTAASRYGDKHPPPEGPTDDGHMPPDEPGHPTVVSLITFGESVPEGLSA